MSCICDSVKLRNINIEDAEILMELNNNEEVANYVVGNPKVVTLEKQLKWIANLSLEKNTKRWIVEYDNKVVGTVILSNIDYLNYVANVNIKILPLYQGIGIGKIVLKEVCKISFDEFGLFCLTANILSFNNKSQKLFEHIGFKQDGILRSRVIKDGNRYDLFTYSLLKTDKF